MNDNEEIRRQLNQLARETLLLKAEVDKAAIEFDRRFINIKNQADELWENIDKKLDSEGDSNERN